MGNAVVDVEVISVVGVDHLRPQFPDDGLDVLDDVQQRDGVELVVREIEKPWRPGAKDFSRFLCVSTPVFHGLAAGVPVSRRLAIGKNEDMDFVTLRHMGGDRPPTPENFVVWMGGNNQDPDCWRHDNRST